MSCTGTEGLGPDALIASLRTGCDYLELNRDILDNLNVYPVPDGDTGINMVSTLRPAVEELARARRMSLREISVAMTAALMRNGRGNSGFILAQFFRGFWEAVGACDSVGPDAMTRGFERGSFTAVRSLLSPVEGTMITIIASMAEAMSRVDSGDTAGCLEAAVEAGRRSLYTTPDLLPLLAEAGVVDAGALGFIFIVRGMLCALLDKEVEAENEASYRMEPARAGTPSRASGAGFRYCVELELETDRAPTEGFRELLLRLGGSVAMIAEDNRARVHIHTNLPDALIEKVGGYGRVTGSRIDDMEERISGNRKAADDAKSAAHGDGVPVLSIIPGPGFRALFQELGAPDCLEYGQTLPSAEDVLDAIDRVRGEDVIVLPNDPNIIPAVRLAADQTAKRVQILRTESVIEGMTAMYGYSESDPVDVNVGNMRDCIGLAQTLRVYRAARDTTFGRFRIKKGHYFVVRGDEMLSADCRLEDCVVTAMEEIEGAGRSHVSFYYADGFDVSGLEKVKQRASELSSVFEFEQHYGGQRKGVLIISVE